MSTPQDPKETLKTLLKNNLTLYKDDGVTQASVLVADEFSEEFWRKYDIIITVGLANQRNRLINLEGSRRETVANYRVGVWTRDGVGIIGQSMRWKALHEIAQIINTNMKNPGGVISWMRLAGRADADKTDIKPVLYHSELTVETHGYEIS